jgi:hypothetical protein
MKSFRFSILAAFLLVGAAVFVLLQRDPLQAQGRLPRSSAWEYKIIRTGLGDEGKSLQEAGAQGWECVSFAFVTHAGATNGACFVLKRPKVGQ